MYVYAWLNLYVCCRTHKDMETRADFAWSKSSKQSIMGIWPSFKKCIEDSLVNFIISLTYHKLLNSHSMDTPEVKV